MAVRLEAEILRTVAHEERDHREDDDRGPGDNEAGGAPAALLDERCEQRQEDELAGGVGCRERAHNQAAALFEPAGRDDRGEDQRGDAGAGPDQHAP